MSQDQFEKTEAEYYRLRGQLAAGRISQQQFEAALKQLVFQDAQGHSWVLGADSGKWYVRDGQSWVEARPQPTTSSAAVPSAAPIAQVTPRQSRKPLFLAAGCVVLLCFVGVGGLIGASALGLVRINFGATARATPPLRVGSDLPSRSLEFPPTATPGFIATMPIKQPPTITFSAPATIPVPPTSSAQTKSPSTGDPYADRVVSFTPGQQAPSGFSDTKTVLGKPDFSESALSGFLTLGIGGSVTVEFVDNIAVDGPGPDIEIYGDPASDELWTAEVSADCVNFKSFGQVKEREKLDLTKVGLASARCVRLTDDGGPAGGASPGAELDAVVALNSSSP